MISWIAEFEDRLLTVAKKKISFSTIDLRWSIEHNRCWINGKVERYGSYKVKAGEKITLFPEKKPFFQPEPERILYEDDHLLLYNKPIHIDSPALATLLGTLLVHRLDRDTSGIILFAKSKLAQKKLEDLFRQRTIKKEYLALVEGKTQKQGVIEGNLMQQGKKVWAKTSWKCLKQGKKGALLQCSPWTGRTHQIRLHLKSIGHPILGDFDYGNRSGKPNLFRPLLHAASLSFNHPFEGKMIHISAPPPEDFLWWEKELVLS